MQIQDRRLTERLDLISHHFLSQEKLCCIRELAVCLHSRQTSKYEYGHTKHHILIRSIEIP